MSREIVFAPEAEAQLVELYRYIEHEASPDVARSYADAIVAHCEKLEDFAERGTPRGDLRPGLRTIAFRRRVTIAFTVDPDRVLILGIFYGGQDFESLVKDV